MTREIQFRETGGVRGSLYRPIVSPSTYKGRRRQGIIRLVWQELWLPPEGESEQAGRPDQ